ncbi:MAG: hypothetical protein K2L99_00805, partial [Muribaculaceae bacterium]|nr:hypothetical protein [Muribaculaceae bacterium]
YKIVVSSLYKNINFMLVSPFEGKPIMVDDTCYQLGFDNLHEAKHIYSALNSPEIHALLNALVFFDAKRVITKNLLMRLDLFRWCEDHGIDVQSGNVQDDKPRQLSLF